MNLLGIAWGMGARDVGMKAAVTGAQDNLDRLNDTLEKQSKIFSKSSGPSFWSRMRAGVRDFNIASIASDVRTLSGDTGELTNGMEAMGVAYAKTARPIVASMDLTGKEARRMTAQITSMAMGMNVGAETVADVFKSMGQAQGPAKAALDALGYSAKDWVKIAETTGVKVSDLTDVMGGMGALWKASAPEEAAFIDRMVEIGKKAGLGLQPIKSLRENIDSLGKPFEKLPPELQRSGQEMMGLAESATRMGGVFRELGSSEEDATSMGARTAQMFAEQAVAIERSQKYGLNALDESPLFKWMTSLGVGYQDATNIIEAGSRDAVKGVQLIQEKFQQMGKGGVEQQAMLAELSGALGESADGLGYLVQNADAGSAALARMGGMTITGKDGLKKYATAAFTTGRTLQDAYNFAKEGFDTQIRSISRADVAGLVGEKMGAFREVGKEMKSLAAKGGPLGTLITGLSTFKQMGIQGVLLQIGKSMGMDTKAAQKMSIKFGMGFDAVQGIAQELGPVMNILGQFGPMGLAAGGIAGFFLLGPENRKKILDTIEPLWGQVKAGLKDIWYGVDGDKGLSTYLSEAWDAAWPTVRSWGGKVWDGVVSAAQTYGPKLLQVLWEGVKGLGSMMMDGISAVFADPKIGIAASLLVAIKAGGIFGAGGAIATMAVGTWVAAYNASEAAMKELKDQQDADEKTRKLRDKKIDEYAWGKAGIPETFGGKNFFSVAGIPETSGGKDFFSGAALGSSMAPKQSVDYAGKFGQSTDAQMAVLSNYIEPKVRKDLQKQFDWIPVIGGATAELIDSALSAQMRAVVKDRTGAGDTKDMVESLLNPEHFSDMPAAVGSAMGARQQNIAAIQGTEAGQGYLSAHSNTPDLWATVVEDIPVFVARAQQAGQMAMQSMEATVGAAQARIAQQSAVMVDGAYTAGEQIVMQQSLGISENYWMVSDALTDTMQQTADMSTSQSPIADGPLAGVGSGGEGDPAYMAGMALMTSFAAGIDNGALAVTESMRTMLQESVFASIDAYQMELQKATASKGLLSQVAGMLMQEYGAQMETSVTVDGQVEDVKASMKAMLNIPGLAGVTMAIINESAKQRQILAKIQENTQAIATSSVITGGSATPGAPVLAS
jgi:hypothetical protein